MHCRVCDSVGPTLSHTLHSVGARFTLTAAIATLLTPNQLCSCITNLYLLFMFLIVLKFSTCTGRRTACQPGHHQHAWLVLCCCRSEVHDRCSWSIEWEGFGAAQQRPGWLHPAVYVLTAACYSYDMECRRLKQRGASYEWLWQSGSQAFWAASEAWATCRKLLSTALHKLRSVTP